MESLLSPGLVILIRRHLDTKVDQVDGAHVNFIRIWQEDGMNRWRWEYVGTSCDDFKNVAKTTAAGRINNNQCTEEKGKTVFDSNQSVGKAGDTHIIRAMKELTGQPCCDMGLPDWGLDTCLEMFRTSDDCDMTKP